MAYDDDRILLPVYREEDEGTFACWQCFFFHPSAEVTIPEDLDARDAGHGVLVGECRRYAPFGPRRPIPDDRWCGEFEHNGNTIDLVNQTAAPIWARHARWWAEAEQYRREKELG